MDTVFQFMTIVNERQRQTAGYAARTEIGNILNCLAGDPKRLENYGFKVYSQSDEDGILEEIFRRLGIENGVFCEIGVENGLECNTLYLIHKGWKGAWIEGNVAQKEKIANKFGSVLGKRLELITAFVTRENINELVNKISFSGSAIDFLSIDIDGNDIYLLEAIDFQPKVICIEYNAKFPASHKKQQTYNPDHVWRGTDYFGASLRAIADVAETKNYTLVGTNITGTNAFLVRKDLCGTLFTEAGNVDHLYNPPRYWLIADHYQHVGHAPDFGGYVDLA
jgi:hypothetical protein